MNSSNFRFVLDLHSTQSQISIPVTLGDTAREWYISLSDGGLPYIIEDGCLAKLEIKRPTGTFIEEFCAIEKNTTIKYPFSQNENTAAVEGVHDCSVTVYDAEGHKIGSPRFSMVVSERVVNSDDINLSDEDKSAIESVIAMTASIIESEEGRINAEALRVTAEEARVLAETARVTTMEETLATVDKKMEAVDNKMTEVDNRVDTKMTEVDAKLATVYTTGETDAKIAEKISEAITTTLNTEV